MFNRIYNLKSIEHLNACYFILSVDVGEAAKEIKPGQFFELKRPDYSHPMLRKPISVYDVQDTTVFFMIKSLGKATEQFSQMLPHDPLDLLGPVGNTFPITNGKQALFVSGGIGYPPLFYLKKHLKQAGKDVFWLHGGRTKDDIFPADEVCTDDGSIGNQGFITDGLTKYLQENKPDVIYACGPNLMLKACAVIAEQHNVPLYVSLEEYMACGIGVCHGCAVKVKADNPIGVDYKTVCKDGPVFDAREIVWE